jgi:urease accessory protein
MIDDTNSDDWLIWQLTDSAFPTGGFAHSGGLEIAVQSGVVRTPDDLIEFITLQLSACARATAPFFFSAHRAAPDVPGVAEIDSACDVFLTNHVANRASRAQGRALITSASRIFPSDPLTALHDTLRRIRSPAHFGPMLGAVAALLRIEVSRGCRLLMFLTARTAVSSAVRLGIIGPMEGQTIQRHIRPTAWRWAREAQRQAEAEPEPAEAATQVSPILELLQSSHDRLYSRLFQS